MKKIIIAIFILIIILSGCNTKVSVPTTDNTKVRNTELNIMTTDKLLYYSILDLTKDKDRVSFMFSKADKINDFKYSDDSLSNISKMDLFIYSGSGMEPWIDSFTGKLSKGQCGIINASRGIKILDYTEIKTYKEYTLKENPYYYLDIDNYKIMMQNVKNALEDKDPKNRDYYEKNFANVIKSLKDYEKKFKEYKDLYKDSTFIVNDEESYYFLKYMDFKYIKLGSDYAGVEDKIKGDKNIFYLYCNDTSKLVDTEFISKNKIVPIKIFENSDRVNIYKIFDYNLEALKDASGDLKK